MAQTTYLTFCRCKRKWRCQCLVPREKKSHPPFNSKADMLNSVGLHPKFFNQMKDAPGAGTYDPPNAECKFKPVSWSRELEANEYSETLGGKRVENYVNQKELMEKGCGPGTHELSRWPENVTEKPCKTNRRDVGFGTVPLFKHEYKSATPGPGFVPYVHNPYYYLDESKKNRGTCVPSFEYDGLQPRKCDTQRIPPWSLPCTLYNVKDPGSLEVFLEKQTGRRGPYDLFTGPRDVSSIKGYWAKAQPKDRGDWPKALPGEIDRLFHKSNYFKGKWTSCPRFTKKPTMRMMLRDIGHCYKDPNRPGPATYNPRIPGKPKNRMNYAFDICVRHVRPQARRDIRPGPDRYKIKEKYSIPGHGWSCSFRSKVLRTTFTPKASYKNF